MSPMKINVHAGHNPAGKIACGAVGILNESTEARKVKTEVIALLKQKGHTVYDCTVNDGKDQSDVLRKIVEKCNAHSVNLDVSIHLNAGANDYKGNGRTTGTEVCIHDKNSKAKKAAENILHSICSLGFQNRGIKERSDLYFLNHTKAPALLIECCFVDDKDDAKLFNAKKMAEKIVAGILSK